MTKPGCHQPTGTYLVVGVLLMSVILLAACEQESTSPIDTSVDVKTELTQAIDFTLPDLAGKPHTLTEYLERGPVMLVFVATWCPYCEAEIPALKQAYRDYGAKGLQVVAINTGLADSEENARAYALKHRLPYPILYDAEAEVSARYQVQAVPLIYLIRPNGRITHSATLVPEKELPKFVKSYTQPTEASATPIAAAARAEPVLGSVDAPVNIVEYGSLTCDYCVRFHNKVLPLIKTRYIDTGQVRFVYRDFPTGAAATRGAVAARCAGDQYYTMLDALFATVGSWSRAHEIDSALIQQAASLGLDEEPFRACLDDPRHIATIDDQQRQATMKYGVTGTPTFLINGKIVRGIQDMDEMTALIQEALSGTHQQ